MSGVDRERSDDRVSPRGSPEDSPSLGELRKLLDADTAWLKDWYAGLFDSGSRDSQGWPMEMHGLVADLKQYVNALPGLLADLAEAERTIAHLREALDQHAHVAEFRDDGWALEHPVECREKGLLNCPVNAAIGALWVQPSIAPGRYVVSLANDALELRLIATGEK